MHHMQAAIPLFHQRGTTFNPVTIVAIQHTVNVADFSMVNMPANNAVQVAPLRFFRQRFLEC